MPRRKGGAEQGGPIYRRVVQVWHSSPWPRVGASRDVRLACGHLAYTWAAKRARCYQCERERDQAGPGRARSEGSGGSPE